MSSAQLLKDSSFRKACSRRNLSGRISFKFLTAKYGINPKNGLRNLFLKLSNFQILIIGDSVMWGQGLAETNKTYSLVADFVRREGVELNIIINNLSHSGAIMGSEAQRSERNKKNGEVPFSFPTIFAQLDISRESLDTTIDLVILNGGINDVGFTSIIDPVSDISEESLRRETRRNCGEKMKQLLKETHVAYPNARIIVTGYYNMFSIQSNPLLYLALLSLLSALPPVVDVVALPVLYGLTLKRSRVFFEISQIALDDAVKDINSEINNQAIFIQGDWDDEHAIFAPKSRLFGFSFDLSKFDVKEANPLNVILEDDASVARARLSACLAEQGDLKCPIACIGHPNIKGAKRNAELITKVLFPL
ncbi:MAG: SGNH/GDSL hydrolase family protein [Sphingobacteriaceae bacterium]|nr:MAG: SGNH/GDSL hydrolase family protein [Sphingobacteriaceae bacterium]